MKQFKIALMLAAAMMGFGSWQNVCAEGKVDLVDPMIGTGFHGHVFVGASVPFGMVQVEILLVILAQKVPGFLALHKNAPFPFYFFSLIAKRLPICQTLYFQPFARL